MCMAMQTLHAMQCPAAFSVLRALPPPDPRLYQDLAAPCLCALEGVQQVSVALLIQLKNIPV